MKGTSTASVLQEVRKRLGSGAGSYDDDCKMCVCTIYREHAVLWWCSTKRGYLTLTRLGGQGREVMSGSTLVVYSCIGIYHQLAEEGPTSSWAKRLWHIHHLNTAFISCTSER